MRDDEINGVSVSVECVLISKTRCRPWIVGIIKLLVNVNPGHTEPQMFSLSSVQQFLLSSC